MGNQELIDGRVSLIQSKKAIVALLQHVRKEQRHLDETELLPGKEQHVWLVMTVKRMQPMKNLKPQKIPLVHPLVDPRNSAVCLITKDPQREYKDLLESHKIKFISRVVGIQKLRGKFKGFDARRLLLRENDLFLADERVLPLLPGLLGKKWFEAKKQPIPVSLTKKNLKAELEKAISSTYMHQNRGTCTSIKIATASQSEDHVLANLTAALPTVVTRIHGGWDNVQSLNIKTSNSVSLPIWSCPLGSEQPGSRWEGMTIDEGEWSGFGANLGDGDIEHSAEPPVLEREKETQKVNGKKRAIESTVSRESAKVENNSSFAIDPTAKLKKVSEIKLMEASPKSKPSKTKELQNVKPSRPSSLKEPKPVTILEPPKEPKPTKDSRSPSEAKAHTASGGHRKKMETGLAEPPLKKLRGSRPAIDLSPSTPSGPAKSAMKKQLPDKSLTRAELTKKKDMLGDAQLTKKKVKLRDADKSAHKGVKAQLIGRVRA